MIGEWKNLGKVEGNQEDFSRRPKTKIRFLQAAKRKRNNTDWQVNPQLPGELNKKNYFFHFSGYKDSSERECNRTASISSSESTENIQTGTARSPARLQRIQETKQLLKKIIRGKRLKNPKYSIWNGEDMHRWLPTVALKRLTKREIARASNDWSFINHILMRSEVVLHSQIVAQFKSLDGDRSLALIRWRDSTSRICRHEWISDNEVPQFNTVDVQNLFWYEKLLLGPFVRHWKSAQSIRNSVDAGI